MEAEKKEANKLPEVREEKNTSIEAIIMRAVDQNASVDVLERLLAMRKELRTEQAREMFAEAMADFQALRPPIPKKYKVLNKDNSVRYRYAKLDDIVELIQEPLSKCGLSYKWEMAFETEPKTGQHFETARCIISHVAGHKEESVFRVPVDLQGAMSVIQCFGSASTYAKRYSLCNALGLSPDEDDDAKSHVTINADSRPAGSTKTEQLADLVKKTPPPKPQPTEHTLKLDEIKAFLLSKWPGDSPADKEQKAATLELYFGTPKWTQVMEIPTNILDEKFHAMKIDMELPESKEESKA